MNKETKINLKDRYNRQTLIIRQINLEESQKISETESNLDYFKRAIIRNFYAFLYKTDVCL